MQALESKDMHALHAILAALIGQTAPLAGPGPSVVLKWRDESVLNQWDSPLG